MQVQETTHRQGDAYVGLFSWRPVKYREENGSLLNPGSPARGHLRDIVAHGVQNVWICEVQSLTSCRQLLFFLLRLVPKQQTAALMTSKSAWLLPE